MFSPAYVAKASSKHPWAWWKEVLCSRSSWMEGLSAETKEAMVLFTLHVALRVLKIVPSAVAVERTNSMYTHVNGLRRARTTSVRAEKILFIYQNKRAMKKGAQWGVRPGARQGDKDSFKLGFQWDNLFDADALTEAAVPDDAPSDVRYPDAEIEDEDDDSFYRDPVVRHG
eukprot:1157324-Rhodomonas_salina.2